MTVNPPVSLICGNFGLKDTEKAIRVSNNGMESTLPERKLFSPLLKISFYD